MSIEDRATVVDGSRTPQHRVRLPGFIGEQEIGLGDLIKRMTYVAGIKPCGGCEKRAAALNRWMVVGSRRV
jgi:hypothetical protein